MGSLEVIDKIFAIISKSDATLDDIVNSFNKELSGQYFRNLALIVNFLSANLLTAKQRLSSLYILVNAFPNTENQNILKQNPFGFMICDILVTSVDSFERKLVSEWILRNPKEKGTTQLKALALEQENFIEKFELQEDFYTVRKSILESVPSINGPKGCELPKIVPDFNTDENKDRVPTQELKPNQISPLETELNGFQCDFMRPMPPNIPLENDELIWLCPSTLKDVQWDYMMCAEGSFTTTYKELFQKALKMKLPDNEEKVLSEAMEKDARLIQQFSMIPDLLPSLTENNPKIAGQLLLNLSSQPEIQIYYEKFLSMEVTICSLEVINKLMNQVELPQDFLLNYVQHCIASCNQMNKKDKMQMNRYVRLVSVFVRTMIKNKLLNPREIYIELQAFCIEFSSVPEASSLFKMLKQIDNKEQ